jgi:hypothetical protein
MKNKKEHPLTFFRKANEARQKLVKKSFGGPGSELTAGPLDENTSKYLDNRYAGKSNNPVLEKAMKTDHERLFRNPELRDYFNAGPMVTKEEAMTVKPEQGYKKGGTVSKAKKRK